MNSLFDKLNEEQVAAVGAPLDGSLLVLAGAGCGKTTVLTRRIAYICSNGIAPSNVCALTFTRKAADEMRERVGSIKCMAEIDAKPHIATFHSFSLSILRDTIDGKENFLRLGYSVSPTLQSENERLKLISGMVTKEEREILGVDLGGLDVLITKCTVFPEKIADYPEDSQVRITKILQLFTEEKRKRGFWGFDDLTGGAIELFKNYPSILHWYQQKFNYFLVDEFQDTNPVQITFLKMLLLPTTGLFAVGDDDQAIYGFRGADVRPTMEFTSLFNSARITKLQINYRSSVQILHAANGIFKNKPVAYRKVLKSGLCGDKRSGPLPKWFQFENQMMMADWILAEGKKCAEKMNVAVTECVILLRVNASLEWLSRYYEQKGHTPEQIPSMMTIHASKGLEYPVVFLCDLEESVFPNYRPPGKKVRKSKITGKILDYFIGGKAPIVCDWDEERRLFYVGVTRAKQVLYMVSVKNKYVYGRLKKFRRSRFR
ncbi:MAG TPA: ATP-dependent helicase [Chitinispirillaceae bacterium]|nr:ATP-dependent helicase [Chitinispirillaceae bacterium]